MTLNIKSTNLELTPSLKEYVERKIDSLIKHFGKLKLMSAKFELAKTTRHHLKGEIYSAEANLLVNGDLLRVVKTAKDMYKAIDKVRDHLEVVIKKYKDKIIERKRKKVKLAEL